MPVIVRCRPPLPALLPALLISVAPIVAAQTAPPPARNPSARPDPGDPAARVPAAAYRSSLADYRRHAEQPVGSWKEANETVNRIGGWRVYAREASQPDAAASAPAAAAPTPAARTTPSPAPADHAGHRPK